MTVNTDGKGVFEIWAEANIRLAEAVQDVQTKIDTIIKLLNNNNIINIPNGDTKVTNKVKTNQSAVMNTTEPKETPSLHEDPSVPETGTMDSELTGGQCHTHPDYMGYRKPRGQRLRCKQCVELYRYNRLHGIKQTRKDN